MARRYSICAVTIVAKLSAAVEEACTLELVRPETKEDCAWDACAADAVFET